jgi:methionyl aminopeptidase
MIFTIEPMINGGKARCKVDRKDGWTARTIDGRLSAQFEHTILITDTGYEALTDIYGDF